MVPTSALLTFFFFFFCVFFFFLCTIEIQYLGLLLRFAVSPFNSYFDSLFYFSQCDLLAFVCSFSRCTIFFFAVSFFFRFVFVFYSQDDSWTDTHISTIGVDFVRCPSLAVGRLLGFNSRILCRFRKSKLFKLMGKQSSCKLYVCNFASFIESLTSLSFFFCLSFCCGVSFAYA
jgi:hypothetical protein